MSNKLLTAAWKVTGLTCAEKCVLARLADFANANGEAFPGYELLADQCSISERHILTVISSLVAKGHLSQRLKSRRAASGKSRFLYTVHPLTPELASGVTPELASRDTGTPRHPTPELSSEPIRTSTEPPLNRRPF